MLELKNNLVADLQLKDLDNKKGIVAFYFAPFGVYDTHNDIHETKAFDKTILEFKEGRNDVLHFRDHIAKANGYDHNEVPGVLTEMGVDQKGAFAVSQLALKTEIGKDTYEQYEAKIIKQHSYGALPASSEFKSDNKGGRILTMRDVKEVSSLTSWAASNKTPVISLKSLEEADMHMKAINHALHHGNMTDKGYAALAGEYKKLKVFLEQKADFVAAMDMTKCWNCKQLLLHLNDDVDIKTMVCTNCGENVNLSDGSKAAEMKAVNVKEILDSLDMHAGKVDVKEILKGINLEIKEGDKK